MGPTRQVFLRTFLAFLVLTALVAIVTVLQGEFGPTQQNILGTSASIALAAVCGLVGAAAIERGRAPAFGRLTIALAVTAGLAVCAAIWVEPGRDWIGKSVVTLAIAALAAAHGLLLWLPRMPLRQLAVQRAALASIGALMLQIDAMVWFELGGDWALRVMTVMAIVVGLLTLAVPILARSRQPAPAAPGSSLLLHSLGDDLYADERGRRYRVQPLPEEQGARVPS